jgi:hypothetical protein
MKANIAFERFALLQDVPASNLGPKTGYINWGLLVVFLSSFRQVPG